MPATPEDVRRQLEHKFWVQNFHGDVADLDALEHEIAAALANVRYDPLQ